jgi:hypothetical protein
MAPGEVLRLAAVAAQSQTTSTAATAAAAAGLSLATATPVTSVYGLPAIQPCAPPDRPNRMAVTPARPGMLTPPHPRQSAALKCL